MDRVTRQCPQTTTFFEEKGEPKRYRTEVLPLTSVTLYRQDKPTHVQQQLLVCVALYLSQPTSKGGNSGDVTIGRLASRFVDNGNGDLCVQFYCKVNVAGEGGVIDVMVWQICGCFTKITNQTNQQNKTPPSAPSKRLTKQQQKLNTDT